MEIDLKYTASVKNNDFENIFDENVYRQLGKLEHLNTNIPEFFASDTAGLKTEKADIKFEYDEKNKHLYTHIVFHVETKPTDIQLSKLARNSTDQLDRGYYGEDGWFVDVGSSGYYILLVDPDTDEKQPVSIEIN